MSFAYALYLCLIVVLGIVVFLMCRRYLALSWILFLALPILLSPFWVQMEVNLAFTTWFGWAKLYSITFYAVLLLSILSRNPYAKKWPFYLVYWMMMLNLIQPVLATGLARSFSINYPITIGGILLMLSTPGINAMRITKEKVRDFYWELSLPLVIGYTLWDLLFVCILFPMNILLQIAVLLAPLLVLFKNKNLYFFPRVYSLAFYFMFYFTFPEWVIGTDLLLSVNEYIVVYGSMGVLAYLVFVFWISWKDRIKQIFT